MTEIDMRCVLCHEEPVDGVCECVPEVLVGALSLLKTYMKNLVERARKVIEISECLANENGICPLCTGGMTGCVVVKMKEYIVKLEKNGVIE